jgi:hypothetical protein
MKNQTTTALILVVLISLFSIRNLQITQTDRGTHITLGKVSLAFNESTYTHPIIISDACSMLLKESREYANHIRTATLEKLPDEHRYEIETDIKMLSSTYDQKNPPRIFQVKEYLYELEGSIPELNNQHIKE